MAMIAYAWFSGGNPQIEGETNSEGAWDEWAFDVLDFNFGASKEREKETKKSSSGTGRGKAKPAEFKKLTFSKMSDTATTALFLACCTGAKYDEFHLVMCKSGGVDLGLANEYLHFTFHHVEVESIDWNSVDDSGMSIDTVGLTCAGVHIKYKTQDMHGNLKQLAGTAGQSEWSQVFQTTKANKRPTN
jgi:type VI protein secretion system component Hcp